MTTDLEKQFFDTFDIQYEFCSDIYLNPCKFQCDDCEFRTERYPEITDRILLELICILAKFEQLMTCCYMTVAEDVEQLKIDILEDCIEYSEHIKHHVQALFKEER